MTGDARSPAQYGSVRPRVAESLWRRLTALFRTRGALGLGPVTAPVSFFVPLGFLLGPQALDWLSVDVLAHLDTLVSVGLAVLGVLVGLAFGGVRRASRPLVFAASTEAGTTLVVVTAAALFLIWQWDLPLDAPRLTTALMLGICAAVSSTMAEGPTVDETHHVADFDDVAPIVLGALVVAGLREPTVAGMLTLGLATALTGLAIAMAGWLLFEVAHGAAERGVFVLGVLVMLGGSAAYLAVSPLLAGLVAGVFWVVAPGQADTMIKADLRKVQHPLVLLLLLTAGASLRLTPLAVYLLAPFLVFRLAGKMAGGWLAVRVVGGLSREALGPSLVWPGVVGIAFALNFIQVAPPVRTD